MPAEAIRRFLPVSQELRAFAVTNVAKAIRSGPAGAHGFIPTPPGANSFQPRSGQSGGGESGERGATGTGHIQVWHGGDRGDFGLLRT